jgi:hypothetical protein
MLVVGDLYKCNGVTILALNSGAQMASLENVKYEFCNSNGLYRLEITFVITLIIWLV